MPGEQTRMEKKSQKKKGRESRQRRLSKFVKLMSIRQPFKEKKKKSDTTPPPQTFSGEKNLTIRVYCLRARKTECVEILNHQPF